jgi:hypothetical protein
MAPTMVQPTMGSAGAHQWEGRLLYAVGYPAPPDFRAPGGWRLSAGRRPVVTQHTTACCSMQVVDITLMKYHLTNITSLIVVQQKHSGLNSST